MSRTYPKKLELFTEARRGPPLFYAERYIEKCCVGGSFATIILGVPGLHIELSRHRKKHPKEGSENEQARDTETPKATRRTG